MTTTTQVDRDQFRAHFLLQCFRKHGTNLALEKDGGLIKVGRELADEMGLGEADAWEAYRYMAKRGYITTTRLGGGNVTADGRDVAEDWLRQLEASPARRIGFGTRE